MGTWLPKAVVSVDDTELTSGLIFIVTKPSLFIVGTTFIFTPTSINSTVSAVTVVDSAWLWLCVIYASRDPTIIFASALFNTAMRGRDKILVSP